MIVCAYGYLFYTNFIFYVSDTNGNNFILEELPNSFWRTWVWLRNRDFWTCRLRVNIDNDSIYNRKVSLLSALSYKTLLYYKQQSCTKKTLHVYFGRNDKECFGLNMLIYCYWKYWRRIAHIIILQVFASRFL